MEIRETINKIIAYVKSLKSHPSDYPELLWVIFVFIGGSINAVAIKNFDNWLDYPVTPNNLVEVVMLTIIFIVVLFLTPFFFSWFFSKNHPEKRLVPPLYIQAVSFGLLVFFIYNHLPTDAGNIYFLGIYTFGAGLFQNRIIVYALGKNARSSDIIKHSLKIHADLEKVKEIILTKQFRNLFFLKRKIQKENTSLKLRTPKNRDWQIILEVKETGKEEETIINLAFYDEGSYNLKKIAKTDDSYEYAISKIEHVKSYFLRRYSIKVEDAPIEYVESLVTFLLDNFQGKLTQLQEMTTRKRFSLIVVLISIGAGIGLIAFNRLEAGIATFGIAIAIIADVLLRR